MARYELLPIFKKAYDLTLYVENLVRDFSRYHKYGLGQELRGHCRDALLCIVRINATVDKEQGLNKLRLLLAQLLILTRLAKDTKALPNFKAFRFAMD